MKEHIVIEIGTNSIKALHCRLKDAHWEFVSDRLYPSRLGEGIASTGIIGPDVMERNLAAIAAILDAQPFGESTGYHIIATESLRKPSNADTFIKLIKARFNLEVELLSGEEEAMLSYLAVTHGMAPDHQNLAILDIGGGSTELATGKDGFIFSRKSFPLGAVKLTEMFIQHDPVTDSEIAALVKYLNETLSKPIIENGIGKLIGVGGTVTSLALLQIPDLTAIDGAVLTLDYVFKQIEKLSKETISSISNLAGIPAGRADIILAGSLILSHVMQNLNINVLTVSSKGVRHGYFYSRFL